MPNIFITIGIPASGKSTLAQAVVDKSDIPCVCINRDNIRKELFGVFFTGRNEDEKQVTVVSEDRTVAAITSGISVILDNTHLNAKALDDVKKLAFVLGLKKVYWFDCTGVALDECKRRNAARDRVVPENVLDAMHSKIPSILEKLNKDEFFIKVQN